MLSQDQLLAGLVVPIDKPRQWTSFQAVNKVKAVVRRLYGLKTFKIGHAGTLDPLATGLLLVCIGKATKTIPELQDGDKVYTGTMVFGATTPCHDLERAIDRRYPAAHITRQLVDQEARKLTGTIMQVPPMFSAVKIDGQRAYEYARTDDPSVTIKPKAVSVYSFETTAFRQGAAVGDQPQACIDGPQSPTPAADADAPLATQLYRAPQGSVPPELPQADFRIHCGKGTYIRSLARDLGLALGSGAFLSALRRESVGRYSVADAVAPDAVEDYLKGL